MREVIRAHSHEHVYAEHASTFKATTDDWLTPAGDCIIGVEAERTPADFDPVFVEACQSRDAAIDIHVRVDAGDGTHEQAVHAHGHPGLTFEGNRSIAFHMSDHMDDRTGAVDAAHAAAGFDRDLASALVGGAELTITIEVEQLGAIGRGVGQRDAFFTARS